MAYQLYRTTTLGITLQETLTECVQKGEMTPDLARTVLLQFDKSMNEGLKQNAKSQLAFKAMKLETYQMCDDVWTLKLNDVEFREKEFVLKVDKVKIVACVAKEEKTNTK
ncbi:transcription initiation factor IIA subunit 2-like [Drosophila guanche]|uniref:Transcription initiation factor IIA subunit 2 n=1 Tax=Drosophila guanche TaxID=7266 RepID=A0A3B0K5X9_DROGU|nr:transcription initiation factor IIA subunit 2-like [Drosophila guanche]SPP88082.1 blast:Transcription initiation factor IIA subunit 2 [Drosophila guanche]